MKRFGARLLLLLSGLIVILTSTVHAQKKVKPFKCGYAAKDFTDLKFNFDHISKYFDCKSNETIASVGASNGAVEAQISVFVDSIDWTIQDIDTTCLNSIELKKVIDYHERLKGHPLKATFEIILGEQCKTNLKSDYCDRILLSNVYHELGDPKCLVMDIRKALKRNGLLVIMEPVAKKIGEKKRDCGHRMIWEPDFMRDLTSLGFDLVSKSKSLAFTYFIFAKTKA